MSHLLSHVKKQNIQQDSEIKTGTENDSNDSIQLENQQQKQEEQKQSNGSQIVFDRDAQSEINEFKNAIAIINSNKASELSESYDEVCNKITNEDTTFNYKSFLPNFFVNQPIRKHCISTINRAYKKKLRNKAEYSVRIYERKIRNAVKTNDISNVKKYLEEGISSDLCDNNGRTLLHYAAENGYRDIVHLLLKWGSNPKLKDYDNNTAMHLAVYNYKVEYLELRLESFINLLHHDKLHGIIFKRMKTICLLKIILKKFTNINIKEFEIYQMLNDIFSKFSVTDSKIEDIDNIITNLESISITNHDKIK